MLLALLALLVTILTCDKQLNTSTASERIRTEKLIITYLEVKKKKQDSEF